MLWFSITLCCSFQALAIGEATVVSRVAAGSIPADAKDIPPPAPGSLQADWWTYLGEASAEQLPVRSEALRGALQNLKASLAGKQVNTHDALIDSVLQSLDRYLKLKLNPRTREQENPELPSAWTLDAVYRLADSIPTLELAHSVAEREIERLNVTIRSRKQGLDKDRIEYLDLPLTEPGRLQRGLQLMRKRLELESLRLVLVSRTAALSIQDSQIRRRRGALDVAMSRVHFTDAEAAALDEEISLLREKVDTADVLADPVVAGILAESDAEGERERLQMTRQMIGELRVSQLNLSLHLKRAERALAAYQLKQSGTSPASVRDELVELEDAADGMLERISQWNSYIERQRLELARLQREREEGGESTGETKTSVDRSQARVLDQAQQLVESLESHRNHAGVLKQIAAAQIRVKEGFWKDLGGRSASGLKQVWGQGQAWFSYSLFEIQDTPVTPAGLVRVVLILVAAWWISFLVRGGLRRLGERTAGANKASLWALGRVLHYVILLVGLLMGLSSIGVDFTKFALLISALGVGIGFGLQNIVSNFVSGLIILFERSLKIGDFVELESGVFGEVREINIRSTRINTNDNVDILVPNSEFVNGRVTNLTLQEEIMRVRIPFGVAYGSDKETVKRAALKAANLVPYTLSRPGYAPSVIMTGFGDSSLDFCLLVWIVPEAVRVPGKIKSAYLWELETQLTEHDIEIPFPQRDLHVRSAFGRRDEGGLELLDELGPSGAETPGVA